MFTLDQARSFIAVAEELHFGKAAARLNMTQPPLSRQIQKLEREVHVELLERDNRKVVLTAAGRAFLAEARKLVAAAEQAPHLARRIAEGRAGILRIGFTAASGFSLLGPLLAEMTNSLPDVDVELQELVTGEQVQALSRGDLDLGLARPPFDRERFNSHLLFAEDLRLAVPSGHALARAGGPVSPSDLRELPMIMHSPTKARYFYDLVARMMPIDHHNVVHSVSQILTMVALVAAGRGVAFVPESTRLLKLDGVSYLHLEGVEPDAVELHAIWSRESANPALSRLVQVLQASAH